MNTRDIHYKLIELNKEGSPIEIDALSQHCKLAPVTLSSHLRILELFRIIAFTSDNKSIILLTSEPE